MIGENIRKLRKILGLSIDAFAERLGVSSGVIINLEYNRLKDPEKKMPLLKLIAKEFGVTVDWIINGGKLELEDLTAQEDEARRMGELIGSDDPVVQSFIEFWTSRTPQEKQLLTEQLQAGLEIFRKNSK